MNKCEIFFSSPEARAAADKALAAAGLSLNQIMQALYSGGVEVASFTHQVPTNFKPERETR